MISRSKLNSRKFAFAVLSFLCTTGLVLQGAIESSDFATIVLAICGSFMASQGYVDAKKEGGS
jgi:hypothetical protein